YGAAAPATPTAAAPVPAFFRNSRRESCDEPSLPAVISFLSLGALSERTAREPRDEAVEERVVDEGQRDGGDQDRGHDPRPVVEVAADQVGGYADRERAVGRARDERDRVHELVHDDRQREDHDGEE